MMMGTKSPVYCRHEYSELPISTTTTTATDSSDSSTSTYAVPEYPSSDRLTYSMTMAPIYQQPLCNCHQSSCPQQIPTPPIACDNRTDSSMSTAATMEKTIDTEMGLKRSNNRWAPVAWIWALVSLILLLITVVCMTQPTWLVNPQTRQSIGLLSSVQLDHDSSTVTGSPPTLSVKSYSLAELPSVCWSVSLVLYSLAACLLAVGTLLAFTAVLLTERKKRERMTFIAGYVQLFSVILLTTSLLFYMVGLDSPTATSVCNSSATFYKADCQLGWSFILIIMVTALGFVLPLLSHYIDYNRAYNQYKADERGPVSNQLISTL